jgi:hypothetical protein
MAHTLVQHLRNLFTRWPLTVSIELPKRVTPANKTINWSLSVLCKQPQTITSIHYEVKEEFEQTHGTRTEHKIYSLGEKNSKAEYDAKPWELLSIWFTVPFRPKAWSISDHDIYEGDMALMNKMSDVAKQTIRTYTLEVTITLASQKVIIERKKITYVPEDSTDKENI